MNVAGCMALAVSVLLCFGAQKTQQYAQKRVRARNATPHAPNTVSYSGVGIALCERTAVRVPLLDPRRTGCSGLHYNIGRSIT